MDTRVVAATSLDIEAAVETRQFREDLFYRLNVVPIVLPALRERVADVPILADHFLQVYSTARRREGLHFAPDVLHCLLSYDWPGNVRELQNVIERAVVTTQGGVITTDNLPSALRSRTGARPARGMPIEEHALRKDQSFDEAVEEFERTVLAHALEQTGWNQTGAAKMLGMSFRAIRYRIKKYALKNHAPAEAHAPADADAPRQPA